MCPQDENDEGQNYCCQQCTVLAKENKKKKGGGENSKTKLRLYIHIKM